MYESTAMYFAQNFTDCCVCWGLYDSAKKFVGYPLVQLFQGLWGRTDALGRLGLVVKNDFSVGDQVYTCTLLGAYSTRVYVLAIQLRILPKTIKNSLHAAAHS
jgi:hypothetical protein